MENWFNNLTCLLDLLLQAFKSCKGNTHQNFFFFENVLIFYSTLVQANKLFTSSSAGRCTLNLRKAIIELFDHAPAQSSGRGVSVSMENISSHENKGVLGPFYYNFSWKINVRHPQGVLHSFSFKTKHHQLRLNFEFALWYATFFDIRLVWRTITNAGPSNKCQQDLCAVF